MKIVVSDKATDAPIYCFVYDNAGFYQGMQKRQPSPLEPGVFLMPRNATEKRPPLKEGFLPKWNGQDWDLVESKTALQKRKQFEDEFASRQQKAFEDLVGNAAQIVRVEMDKRWNELQDGFGLSLKAFREEIGVLVSLGLGEAKEKAREEIRALVKRDLEVELQSLVVMRAELEEAVRQARLAVQELNKPAPQVKGLLSRLIE